MRYTNQMDEIDEDSRESTTSRHTFSLHRPARRSTLSVLSLEEAGIEVAGGSGGRGDGGAFDEVEQGRRPRALVKKRSASITATMLMLFKLVSCEEGGVPPPLLRAGVALGASQEVTADEETRSGLSRRDDDVAADQNGVVPGSSNLSAFACSNTSSRLLRAHV